MAKIPILNEKIEDYTIVLSNRSHQHIGQLYGLKGIGHCGNLNSANELCFDVYKYKLVPEYGYPYKTIEAYREMIWNQIVDLKFVYVKELDEYYQIKVTIDDGNDLIKHVAGTSQCEAELSQLNLDNFEINTESDILRPNYEVTTFYNVNNPNASLLHRALKDKAPHYSIKYVDPSLHNIQRTFSVNGTSIYDFFVGECSEQISCLFQFDTTDRSISVYDLLTVCDDCGKRGDFENECPDCNSKNLKYFGKDTTIYVDKTNLTDNIHLEVDSDSIKNCFKLETGDEIMDAAVRSLNPNGSNYIFQFRQEDLEDMPTELVQRLNSYNERYDSYVEEYQDISAKSYELIDDILYYESSMMPMPENAEVTAETEATKLTTENLSPIALTTVSDSTSLSTVNSALKNYAKVFVKTGYVKLEIEPDATLSNLFVDENKFNCKTWYGRFKVTNYSDEEDIAYSDYMTITVNDNYHEFIIQKVEKNIKSNDDEEGSVFDVLAIENFEKFKEALTLYSLNKLISFRDAIQGALDVLIQMDQANEEADLYQALYSPYYEKLKACESEIDKRQLTINGLQKELDSLNKRRDEIHADLDMQEYLRELYPIFCSYRREDVYNNSNYISDGLDNTQLLERAKEFLEVAKKELLTASSGKCTITSTLYNLLVIKEFEPIVEYFELGNWIRVQVDGILYKLRLIGYDIDFNDLNTINVTFSTVNKTYNVETVTNDIINSTQSMSTKFTTISKQAEQGKNANDNLNSIYQNGLDSGLIQIKNNNKEEVIWDKNGILLREYDDISGTYDDKQSKVTHNVFAYTSNNWKTVEQVIGEHEYTYYDSKLGEFKTAIGYGVSSKFSNAAYFYGGQIVGSEIYSTNYSPTEYTGSYLDLDDGTFSFAGGRLRFDGTNLLISSPDVPTSEAILQINEDYLKTTNIVANNLQVNSVNILGEIIADSVAAENLTGTTITGKFINGGNLLIGDKSGTYAEITSNGKLTCVDGVFKGKIVSSSFTVDGTIVKTANDYTEEDLDIIKGAIMGTVEYTPELIEKYDIDGDGVLHATDYMKIKNLLNGTVESYSVNTTVEIDPMNNGNIIKTDGVAIRSNGIYSKNATVDDLYVRKPLKVPTGDSASYYEGLTENISIGDKILNVINGIIVSYQ